MENPPNKVNQSLYSCLTLVQGPGETNPDWNRAIRYSRHTDEGRVATVKEGAVDHLQDEGEVLERQVCGGGAH